jgi:Tfp pilus assembly protein PilN
MSTAPLEQQVNLYQPILGAERRVFSARAIGVALACFALALGAFAAFGAWRTARIERSVRLVEQQQSALLAMLEHAGGDLKAHQSLEALKAEAQSLSADIAARERALEVLRAGSVSPATSFAARLESLARPAIPGLWLDDIAVGSGAGRLALHGATLDANLLPEYLAAIAREPAFSGVRFDSLSMRRAKPAEAPARLIFELGAPGLTLASDAAHERTTAERAR